jgi:hypothetical protein
MNGSSAKRRRFFVSFVEGFGSVLDLGGTAYVFSGDGSVLEAELSPHVQDAEAIASDWRQVGTDILAAAERLRANE